MLSQHLMVTARRFTVIIEEKLLLKLLSFFGYGQTEAGGSLDNPGDSAVAGSVYIKNNYNNCNEHRAGEAG